MSNQQFALILTNIAATLTERRTAECVRLTLARLQVANALTMLEQPRSIFDDGAPHRKFAEGRDMDADLEALQDNKVSLIVRLTDTQLDEIEAERWGE